MEQRVSLVTLGVDDLASAVRASWRTLVGVIGAALVLASTFLTWSQTHVPHLLFQTLGLSSRSGILFRPHARDLWRASSFEAVILVACAALALVLALPAGRGRPRAARLLRGLTWAFAVMVFFLSLFDLLSPLDYWPPGTSELGSAAGVGEVVAVSGGVMLAVFASAPGGSGGRVLRPAGIDRALWTTLVAGLAGAWMLAATFLTWSRPHASRGVYVNRAAGTPSRYVAYTPPGQDLWLTSPLTASILIVCAGLVVLLPSRWSFTRPVIFLSAGLGLIVALFSWANPPAYGSGLASGWWSYPPLGSQLADFGDAASRSGAGEIVAVVAALALVLFVYLPGRFPFSRRSAAPGQPL